MKPTDELRSLLAGLQAVGVDLRMETDVDDEPDDDESDEGDENDKGQPAKPTPEEETAKWKHQSRKHEARSKENADKARKFDELQASSKTEAERLADRAEQAEKRAAEAERRNLQNEIGADLGLPKAMWSRLQGADEDELRADAEELATHLTPVTGEKKSAEKPVAGNAGAGARGKEPTGDQDDDMESFYKNFKERKRS